MSDQDVLLAIIGAPHGVKGEVRVKSFTEDPEGFGDYGKLHDAGGRKFQVLKTRPSKNVVITRFKSVDTREKAEALKGVELYVDRSVLPELEEEDEFYIQDLIGCDVRNEAGEHIGTVMSVPNFGAGDMLEIGPRLQSGGISGDTYYLPFTRKVVPVIDFDKWYIVVVPPKEVSERDSSTDTGQEKAV